MKALLERAKGGGLVILAACCLAFSAAADDGQANGDDAQAASTNSCQSNCTTKYEMCVAAGGSVQDCTANRQSCSNACSSDDTDL